MAIVSGANRNIIYKGIHELGLDNWLTKGRVRKPGGGRKCRLDREPVLLKVFDSIICSHISPAHGAEFR